MSKCYLEISDDLLIVRSPYKKGFVEGLKNTVPREYRYFDFQDKTWELDPSYLDKVINLAQRFYTDVYVDEICRTFDGTSDVNLNVKIANLEAEISILKKQNKEILKRQNARSDSVGHSNWGKLKKYLDVKVLDKLYKALAYSHHPDKGGSTSDMQEINRLIDELKKGIN